MTGFPMSRALPDAVLDAAMEKLKANGILNDRLLLSIRALRRFHDTIRNDPAYVPSGREAWDFILTSISIRRDLGDKVD
jgi:hypothetical protein